MTTSDYENGQLEGVLARSYELLKQPVAGEREAILAKFAEAKASPRRPANVFKVPRAMVLAVAACLVMAVSARLFVVSPARGVVHAFEASGQRLLEAQTVRLRGTRFEYESDKAEVEPVRVPFEYLVKRPDKHSLTWTGVTRGKGPMVVTRGTSQCDGQVGTHINDSTKQYLQTPIHSPLSAKLSAESFAQGFLLSAALGPPEAPFRKIGEEKIDGRWLHLYEGRFKDEIVPARVTKLWFDPTRGHPVRLVRDTVLKDGSLRRDEEIDEIAVNVPLADELFRRPAPEGYTVLSAPAAKAAPAEAISTTPTSSGAAFGAKLEVWYALRIIDQAALVVWRRSVPQSDGGAVDWLANMEFKLDGPEQRQLRHTWIHQSLSRDRWNWSVLAVANGSLSLRDDIVVELHNDGSVCATQMLVLRLTEDMLNDVVAAAGKAMLPESAARPSLAELREKAKSLVEFGGE